MRITQPDLDDRYRGDPPIVAEYEGFEVYPMPAFVRFPVPDPEAVARWYVEALGFGVMYVGPPVGEVASLVHLRRRKYQDILLVPGQPRGGGVVMDATGEIDDLAARASSFGPHAGVEDMPYGPRELRLSDPAGHEIVLFAAPERPSATIDEAMTAAIEGLDRETAG